MKVLNYGSVNIDHVYNVPHLVRPGETLSASGYQRYPGGKGLNQTIALARAGVKVFHAGSIGTDAGFIRELLESEQVDCTYLQTRDDSVSGHAFIQVADSGENSIVLFAGANGMISDEQISAALSIMEPGDILLLQNEISGISQIMQEAIRKKLRIFFNPAPMSQSVLSLPLAAVETLVVNETEASELAGCSGGEAELLACLRQRLPEVNIVMTLGARGALYSGSNGDLFTVPACPVEKVVDTTAAGDTFIGYFIAGIIQHGDPQKAMHLASCASARCISHPGAASSIPRLSDLV